MGIVWAIAIHTLESRVVAGSASYTTGGSRASVPPRGVGRNAPTARSRLGTLVAVVAKILAIGALCKGIEAQTAFSPKGG